MKKLFVVAYCLFLMGCAAEGGLSQSTGLDPMDSDGRAYVPRNADSFEPLPAEEKVPSTCTMKGESVQCF